MIWIAICTLPGLHCNLSIHHSFYITNSIVIANSAISTLQSLYIGNFILHTLHYTTYKYISEAVFLYLLYHTEGIKDVRVKRQPRQHLTLVLIYLVFVCPSQTMHYHDDLKIFHTVEIKEHFDAMANPPKGYVSLTYCSLHQCYI